MKRGIVALVASTWLSVAVASATPIPQETPVPNGEESPKKPVAPAPPTAPPADPAAVAAVDRYLEALGGRETLGAIEDLSRRTHIERFARGRKSEVEVSLRLRRGGMIREDLAVLEFKIAGRPLVFTQLFNPKLAAESGWVRAFGAVSPLEGKTLETFREGKHLDDFFLHWKENGYRLAHRGSGTVGDRSAELVEARSPSGEVSTFAFDPKSNLLVAKIFGPHKAGASSTERTLFYQKYRSISFADDSDRKITVPFAYRETSGGEVTRVMKVSEFRVNTGLDEKLFAKPVGLAAPEPRRGTVPGQ